MEVGHEVLERGIVGVWELVDLLVQADVPQPVIVEPGGLHEGAELAVGEERVRQLAEPELERARNDVDVGIGVVVLEVDGRNVCSGWRARSADVRERLLEGAWSRTYHGQTPP